MLSSSLARILLLFFIVRFFKNYQLIKQIYCCGQALVKFRLQDVDEHNHEATICRPEHLSLSAFH